MHETCLQVLIFVNPLSFARPCAKHGIGACNRSGFLHPRCCLVSSRTWTPSDEISAMPCQEKEKRPYPQCLWISMLIITGKQAIGRVLTGLGRTGQKNARQDCLNKNNDLFVFVGNPQGMGKKTVWRCIACKPLCTTCAIGLANGAVFCICRIWLAYCMAARIIAADVCPLSPSCCNRPKAGDGS